VCVDTLLFMMKYTSSDAITNQPNQTNPYDHNNLFIIHTKHT
jgi:hypothetical protein